MEDVGLWEHELRESDLEQPLSPPGLAMHDLETEELAAYAEEYAAFADFADLDGLADELFELSDMEDGASVHKTDTALPSRKGKRKADVDMAD
jgi:hypothetical protein